MSETKPKKKGFKVFLEFSDEDKEKIESARVKSYFRSKHAFIYHAALKQADGVLKKE